jgi:hypothetical protein
MPSLGWNDPIWKQLYGSAAAAPEPQPTIHSSEGPVDYLSQLQQAAAAGTELNLSDLPGFQTNLLQPE